MNSIYALTTHHERRDEAAEVWHELGICAIGFVSYGRLKRSKNEDYTSDVRTFLKIKKGDLVLAYAAGNRIAYIGDIADGVYLHRTSNVVGLDEDEGGFGYPNQYKVRWFDKPYDFSRYDLPDYLWKQLGKRGRTVVQLSLYRRSFDEVKQIILATARSGSLSYDINEDTVKAGIRKYLRRQIDSLEKGLKITKSEERTSKTDQPDFVARDKNGKKVIIECKGYACPIDCDQLDRYGKSLAKEKPRLMLVAFRIDDGCLKEAERNSQIELFECDLKFKKVSK